VRNIRLLFAALLISIGFTNLIETSASDLDCHSYSSVGQSVHGDNSSQTEKGSRSLGHSCHLAHCHHVQLITQTPLLLAMQSTLIADSSRTPEAVLISIRLPLPGRPPAV
jgi:hypothetical protein